MVTMNVIGFRMQNNEVRHGAADSDIAYDASEQDILIAIFTNMLRTVTIDGGKKRAAKTKLPWWQDDTHPAAMVSHILKWMRDELRDPDSGAHPLVHLAWRALAQAYQETHGKVAPV